MYTLTDLINDEIRDFISSYVMLLKINEQIEINKTVYSINVSVEGELESRLIISTIENRIFFRIGLDDDWLELMKKKFREILHYSNSDHKRNGLCYTSFNIYLKNELDTSKYFQILKDFF